MLWGGGYNHTISGCGVAKVRANQRLHKIIVIGLMQRFFVCLFEACHTFE